MSALVDRISEAHAAKYGGAHTVMAFAPGRVEVLGNHADYNGGTVLSFAIDPGVAFCLSPSRDSAIRLYSVDYDESATLASLELGERGEGSWAEFVRGVLYHLRKQGVEADGVDCTFGGSLPIGGGLSSSAALSVSCASAMLAHLGRDMDRLSIARICRDAESDFAHSHCGLLDPLSSLHGIKDSLLHINFESLVVKSVALPVGTRFMLVDPGAAHRLAETPYNQRREACERALEALSLKTGRSLTSLGQVSQAEFASFERDLPEDEAMCAAHVLGEIRRVASAIDCLARDDVRGFGELLYESHQSSRELFRNSCSELDTVVEAAKNAGALGARLSGGGWGGNALVFAHSNEADSIARSIGDECKRAGILPEIKTISPAGGAVIMKR